MAVNFSISMNITPGTIILSAPSLTDPNFEKAVILITGHNEKGASGFVINKIFPRTLNELTEFMHAKPVALYSGGPVDTENLFVLHNRGDLVEENQPLFGDTCMGGDFKQIVQLIDKGTMHENNIKLFIGYCGWDAGELEAEIAEGSWIRVDADKDIVFNTAPGLWETLLPGNGMAAG